MIGRRKPRTHSLWGVGLAICLSGQITGVVGCASVGPDFRGVESPDLQPKFANRPDRRNHGALIDLSKESSSPLRYTLTDHDDEKLRHLIHLALSDNPSVHELSWRICEARSVVSIVSGQRYPFAHTRRTYQRRKQSQNAQPFVGPNGSPFTYLSVGVDSRWEVDLVGRIERETQAAKADYRVTIEDLNDLKRVLAGDVARAYVDVRRYQELVLQIENNLKIQRLSMTQVESRLKAGTVGTLDLEQMQSRITLTESDKPLFEEKRRLSINRLAILIGYSPNIALTLVMGEGAQLKSAPAVAGVPCDLLRHRADIRRAEREVAAACARIGVAQAELYPKLSLLGTVSLDTKKLSNLFDRDSIVFGVGPSFSWNILSLGRIERSVDVQKAQVQQAIARYQQTVLAAVEEVENGLVSHQQVHERIEILTSAVESAGKAVELANEQYAADLATLERIVSNQERLLRASVELANARADAAIASVSLVQAVGGQF